jgi:hypothetical protein
MKKTEPIPPQTQYASTDSPSSGSAKAYDYPGYEVHFSGASMAKTITVTGPHTFALLQPDGTELTVSLSRNAPRDGKPSLNITFS